MEVCVCVSITDYFFHHFEGSDKHICDVIRRKKGEREQLHEERRAGSASLGPQMTTAVSFFGCFLFFFLSNAAMCLWLESRGRPPRAG